MVADSNSQIAWHRAQIKKHRAALKQIETGRHNFGEIAGSKTIGSNAQDGRRAETQDQGFRTDHRGL